MNKTFFYLALMLCASFAISCGSDDDDPIVPPTNEEQKDPQRILLKLQQRKWLSLKILYAQMSSM